MAQPEMTSKNGVVATIGIKSLRDRCALVIPLASDTLLDPHDMCSKARAALDAQLDTLLCPILSQDAFVQYVQAVGMDNGRVPYRTDYADADHPGTGAAGPAPSSVGLLTTFYQDTDDVVSPARIRHSRMIIPGCPSASLVNGYWTTVICGLANTLASALINGFNAGVGEPTFYRVLSAPPPTTQGGLPDTPLARIGNSVTHQYVGSQRRRLLPH